MIKVILDANGADYSPIEPVLGAIKAVKENKNLHIIIFGNEDEINSILDEYMADKSRFTIINATETITNFDVPTEAIRNKKESSMVKAFDYLKQNADVYGMVSGGSTGALLTGAFMKIGRIKGVSRPALCPFLPNILENGKVSIVDCGANADCKPINLVHFAIMGNAYFKHICDIKSPKIGLLSIGSEETKGNELVHQTYPLLNNLKDFNFIGNVEGRDLLFGGVDVVVTDGFNGNVLLKSTEGAIMAFQKILKREIKSHISSSLGALFMKSTFRNLKNKLDYNNLPGAVLLGCKKVVVKSHGSAKANSFKESILQVVKMAEVDLCNIIESEVAKVENNE